MPKFVDQSPSPRSHIKTLMRIGYTLNSAVADIVDNSIAAGAKTIDIVSLPGTSQPIISILDDGSGMTLEELKQNMRIGCKDPDAERRSGDLGRFGSGMKTASFSQARCLTVITKRAGHPMVAASWDIDDIEANDSWCLKVFDPFEVKGIEGLSASFPVESGTQLILSKLSFLETGSHARDQDSEMATRLAELKSYIALHFHRFMSGADKRSFKLNGDAITPVDPFMIGERGYQEGPSEKLRCKGGRIEISTHVLPHLEKMSKSKLDELGGAEGIQKNQGLYIYREKRLIIAGDWLGMQRSTPTGALARIQVDIPSSLDRDWSTDVKKASLQIPPRVKRSLRRFLADPVKRSKNTYTYRGKQEQANDYWKICENENSGHITYQIDADNELLRTWIQRCDNETRWLCFRYLKELAERIPINHIYEKMSESPREINQQELDLTTLKKLIEKVMSR